MRKTVSLILLFSGIVELVTIGVLYVLPSGRVAYWTDYRLMGLDKTQWSNIHLTVGVLLLAASCFHLYYNWKPILSYLKSSKKRIQNISTESGIAFLFTLVVVGGTLLELPPMVYVIRFSEHITTSANQKYGEPPYGHAELSSLNLFAKKMNMDSSRAISLLRENDLDVQNGNETLLAIARNNQSTPQIIYEIIKPAIRDSTTTSFPDSPYPGFGNTTIYEICKKYSLPVSLVLEALDDSKHSIRADATVKEAARQLQSSPMQLFERIKDVAAQREDR